jgi:hypothetical protein
MLRFGWQWPPILTESRFERCFLTYILPNSQFVSVGVFCRLSLCLVSIGMPDSRRFVNSWIHLWLVGLVGFEGYRVVTSSLAVWLEVDLSSTLPLWYILAKDPMGGLTGDRYIVLLSLLPPQNVQQSRSELVYRRQIIRFGILRPLSNYRGQSRVQCLGPSRKSWHSFNIIGKLLI